MCGYVLVAPDGWLGLTSVSAYATPVWITLRSSHSRIIPSLRTEIPAWLDTWTFTRFVTLATNDPTLADKRLPTSGLPYAFLRDRLRNWDARINHAILGHKWAKRHSDRIFSFYFLEKPDDNPHWHGLVSFFPIEDFPQGDQEKLFDENAGRIWKSLVKSGTTDIQPVTCQKGVAEYVSKMLPYPLSYEFFVAADELRLG